MRVKPVFYFLLLVLLSILISCDLFNIDLHPWPDVLGPETTLDSDEDYINFGLSLYGDVIEISEDYHQDGFPASTVGITHSYPEPESSYQYAYSNFDRGAHIANTKIPPASLIYDGTQYVDHPFPGTPPRRDSTRYIESLRFTVTINKDGTSTPYNVRLVADTYNLGPVRPHTVAVTFTTFEVEGRTFTQEEIMALHPNISLLKEAEDNPYYD